MTDRWTVQVEEDPETGDLVLPLPEEMLSRLGWNIGDDLNWEKVNENWTLKKIDKKD